MFSRFDQTVARAFAITTFVFVIVGLFTYMYLWVQFDKDAMSQEIHAQDGVDHARLVFNSWIWSTSEAADAHNRRRALLNEMSLRLIEMETRALVEKRNDEEWSVIYNRRTFVNVAAFIVLAAGWVGLYFGQMSDAWLLEQASKVDFLKDGVLVSWIPSVSIVLINIIVPNILT